MYPNTPVLCTERVRTSSYFSYCGFWVDFVATGAVAIRFRVNTKSRAHCSETIKRNDNNRTRNSIQTRCSSWQQASAIDTMRPYERKKSSKCACVCTNFVKPPGNVIFQQFNTSNSFRNSESLYTERCNAFHLCRTIQSERNVCEHSLFYSKHIVLSPFVDCTIICANELYIKMMALDDMSRSLPLPSLSFSVPFSVCVFVSNKTVHFLQSSKLVTIYSVDFGLPWNTKW